MNSGISGTAAMTTTGMPAARSGATTDSTPSSHSVAAWVTDVAELPSSVAAVRQPHSGWT
ncbi:unannotated protein [freshwater metagenome]|uniref:Unannotated protein n=1 Tax=freshwater metagenome TaxID=449393 RepID=A0A6J7KSH2_9ZZZZ